MMKEIYTGTYTQKTSKGIYRFFFDDGKLSKNSLFCEIKNPKYLCAYKDMIVAVNDFEEGAGVSLIDKKGKIIDALRFEEKTSCYVCSKDDYIYTANYHEGTISKLKIEDNKIKLIKKVLIREKAGCHQILLYKDLIMVPCLFLDRVMIYDNDLNYLKEIEFKDGTGVRHGVFSKDKRYLYLLSELSNELFKIDMESLKIIDSIAILDNDERHVKGSAAIRIYKDRYLYVSTRFKNLISLVDLESFKLVKTFDCKGDHPRDFDLIGDYLLCGNMNSDEVICFKIAEDGMLEVISDKISTPEPICLLVL